MWTRNVDVTNINKVFMETHRSYGCSSDISDEEEEEISGALSGTLSKWTNYIHGWQDRFMALHDGTLVYYKSEHETDFGCRGAISVRKATLKCHELDELRFDVSVSSDCVWYLRAGSVEDRARWIEALENSKHEELDRVDSALSLTCNAAQYKKPKSVVELSDKVSELETLREICKKQIDNLQHVFDSMMSVEPSHSNFNTSKSNVPSFNFKAESITFKVTSCEIIASLQSCISLLNSREDYWRKKFEKELSLRRIIEEKYQQHSMEKDSNVEQYTKVMLNTSEERSQIGEEEFYDAVENALDKLQEEQNYLDKLKLMSEKPIVTFSHVSNSSHPLWSLIDKVTMEQLHYARLPVGDIWELFAEDGEMKMYKREEEVDGLVVDPLKAVHQVHGVTARELCHHFFSPEFRLEWEATVEQATVLEKISDETLIFLQLHKRLWPSAQRDSLFWSHIRKIQGIQQGGQSDTWLVCNKSTKHPDAPDNKSGNCLRIDLTVIFVCDTEIHTDEPYSSVSRNDISCKITYCSVVNPGGWVPAPALRAVYKREYPKFLKRFTGYVINKTKNKPLMW